MLKPHHWRDGFAPHWGIENQLHRVPDMAFREDVGRKKAGYSAENFSRLLRFARNILKHDKDTPPRQTILSTHAI